MVRGWILLLAAMAHGQIVLNPPPSASTLTVDVTMVNVYCSVRNGQGAFLRDLAQGDFEVREDGKRQEIKLFAREVDSPLTIALLLDVSGSVAAFVEEEKSTAARFFRDFLLKEDKAMVAGFAERIAVWQDFTGSADELEVALERQAEGLPKRTSAARGGTLLFDAVRIVAEQKLRRRGGRKLLMVISDGLDSGSIAAPAAASRAAQEADAVVYGIHFGEDDDGLAVLEKLAGPTGGRAFRVTKKTPLSGIFAAIRDEMRGQYGLAYRAPDPDGKRAFRRLDVKVKRGDAHVRARAGYYR